KAVSLNEAQRRQQIEEAKTRLASRRAEREKRTAPRAKVFDVTLSNLDQPTVPSPVGRTNPSPNTETQRLLGEIDENNLLPNEFSDGMVPALDIILEETEHILADYVALLHREM